MGETNWGTPITPIQLTPNLVLAQTFSPLWSHNLERVRYRIRATPNVMTVKVSIQYLNPDGTPAGLDLSSVITSHFTLDPTPGFILYQKNVPPIHLVAGIQYAFLIQLWISIGLLFPFTTYQAPPGSYPRGKLIKSTDGGSTWDTSDHGDLHFAEYGDPPKPPDKYNPPSKHWAVVLLYENVYHSSACIRIATTEPCEVTCHVTFTEPKVVGSTREIRGVKGWCPETFSFPGSITYAQHEEYESLYHTFYIKKLKHEQKYWFCFTAYVDNQPTLSMSPIFERTHIRGPGFETVRRPNAPGDVCDLRRWRGDPCPDHWKNVDEATSDEDETYVASGTHAAARRYDLYNIPDLDPADTGPIGEVHLIARVKRSPALPTWNAGAWIQIKTHGTIYGDGVADAPFTWGNIHWHVDKNPFTGLPWTREEINDLQIGIKLQRVRLATAGITTYCTQLYCYIEHACEPYQ